jgi:hypothetical protein
MLALDIKVKKVINFSFDVASDLLTKVSKVTKVYFINYYFFVSVGEYSRDRFQSHSQRSFSLLSIGNRQEEECGLGKTKKPKTVFIIETFYT